MFWLCEEDEFSDYIFGVVFSFFFIFMIVIFGSFFVSFVGVCFIIIVKFKFGFYN